MHLTQHKFYSFTEYPCLKNTRQWQTDWTELNRLVICVHIASVMQSIAENCSDNKDQDPTKPVWQVLMPTNTWQFTFLWDRWYWYTHAHSSKHSLRRGVWLVSTLKPPALIRRAPLEVTTDKKTVTPKTVDHSTVFCLQGLGLSKTLLNHVSSLFVELHLILSSYYWWTVECSEPSTNLINDHTYCKYLKLCKYSILYVPDYIPSHDISLCLPWFGFLVVANWDFRRELGAVFL